MLSREDNELITRTGPDTPGGRLFRHYWHPVALSRELPLKAPPKPVRLLGEDLVLFRTKLGVAGLMDLHCPHRGTDLSYGRVEDDGLRCLYHGWKMGLDGRCLDQPGEPKGSNFKNKVRHVAYPCREAGGLIFAYMGEGEPPPLPKLPMFDAADGHVWSSKMFHECNYLQGVEGEVDSQHLSYLHRMITPGSAPDEYQKGTDWLLAADEAPDLEFEQTGYGMRLFATRRLGDGRKYVRVTNFIMPYTGAFDGGPLLDPRTTNMTENMGYWMHWHVPIDDTHHWKYIIAHCYDSKIDPEYQYRMIESEMTPEFTSTRNKANRYLQNRDEMERTTFLGMGFNFQNHDRFATESQRPISDRTKEHLGASDRNVTAMRRLILQAIKDADAGRAPLGSTRADADPLDGMVVVSKTVPLDHDNKRIWSDFLAERRAAPAAAK
jgi:phenylpropionate dioxygenase-like ring-hydroxylating dioxygenase large terminal subunit